MAQEKSLERPTGQGQRVFRTVSEDLVQRIRTGEWLPNERLPSIAQLARELGASTGSVREALRSLQSSGLVRIEHGRGVGRRDHDLYVAPEKEIERVIVRARADFDQDHIRFERAEMPL